MNASSTMKLAGSEHATARRYPRISVVHALHAPGVRFHVTSGAEAFRVERFGGEEAFTRAILDELRPGDVLFDIGACIGFVSIHAAMRGARVVSFEPDPSFRSRLLENAVLNEVKLDRVVDWAVSDRSGEARLFTDGVTGHSPSLHAQTARGSITIRTRSIDESIDFEETGKSGASDTSASGEWIDRLPLPDVMKIDIEGAEVRALVGMSRLLSHPRAPRTIFIELHPTMVGAFGDEIERAGELLERAGYRVDEDEARYDQFLCTYRRAGRGG